MASELFVDRTGLAAANGNDAPVPCLLSEVLKEWVNTPLENDPQVSGVQLDSRLAEEGNLFIALQGLTVNAMDYLNDLIDAKIAAVVTDSRSERPTLSEQKRLTQCGIVWVQLDNLSSVAGEIVSRVYNDPSRSMKIVGVTGTDGKTSVCHMVGQALNEHRDNCGIIGTLGWGYTNRLTDAGLTTPDSVRLQTILSRFSRGGASYAAMEVSSHALAQNRTAGIVFDVVVFTNLGRDHLDYHGDMKSYREAKESLFLQPGLRAAVINTDDDFGRSLAGRLTDLEVITFGSDAKEGRHVRCFDLQQTSSGLTFTLQFDDIEMRVQSSLMGKFNAQNLAATFAVLVALGVSPDLASRSLSSLASVPGRMEATRLANGAVAVVDYAHNPHALESVLQSATEHVEGRLLLVFGCGGDRDRGKRPAMANIAERYADLCIVTDDNPRGEDGDEIVKEILEGFDNVDSVTVIRDRRAAIEAAINNAVGGDLVIIAGKGHEDYQLVGDQRLPFSDSAVVAGHAEALAS